MVGIWVNQTVEIGLSTPPLGLNPFFVRNGAPEIALHAVCRGWVLFIVAEFVLDGALIFWPAMSQVLLQ